MKYYQFNFILHLEASLHPYGIKGKYGTLLANLLSILCEIHVYLSIEGLLD